MVNLYTKNGIVVDVESEVLRKSDGHIVTNATRDMWEAEGWLPYVPKPIPSPEPTVRSTRESVLSEAEAFAETKSRQVWIDDELVDTGNLRLDEYRILVKALADSDWLPFMGKKATKKFLLVFLESLDLLRCKCLRILFEHQENIKKLETVEDLNSYDYTAGYSKDLVFKITTVE